MESVKTGLKTGRCNGVLRQKPLALSVIGGYCHLADIGGLK